MTVVVLINREDCLAYGLQKFTKRCDSRITQIIHNTDNNTMLRQGNMEIQQPAVFTVVSK